MLIHLYIHGEGSYGLVIIVRKVGNICVLSRPLLLVKYKSYNSSWSLKVQNIRRKSNAYKTQRMLLYDFELKHFSI